MVNYICSRCSLIGHKLWREIYATDVKLLCAVCAEDRQKVQMKLDSDVIGNFIPAIPVDGSDNYWGYSSTSNEAIIWWYELPTFNQDPKREIMYLKVWMIKRLKGYFEYRDRYEERVSAGYL